MGVKLKMSSKYTEFMSLAISYLKNIDKNISSLLKNDKENTFDGFLLADMVEQCAQMHANGYEGISKKSKQILEEKILDEIADDPAQYKKYLNIYGHLSNDFKKKCLYKIRFSMLDRLIEAMGDEFKEESFRSEIKEMVLSNIDDLTKEFPKKIVIEYSAIGSIGGSNRIYVENFYKKIKHWLVVLISATDEKDVDIFHQFCLKLTKLKEDQIKFVKKINKKGYPNYHRANMSVMEQEKLDSMIDLCKTVIQEYSTESAQTIISGLKKEALKLETTALNRKLINELPSGAKALSEEIKSKYESLSADVNVALKFDLDRRIDDMNKIIKKYLALDLDYRDSLKNVEGKSAYDLMVESLSVVNSDFDKLIKDHNQGIVNEISVLNRKSVNKKIL